MRLVSQAGVSDIPYEKAVIFHNMDGVRAVVDGREYLLGEYSNILKSQKVMKMVRDAYCSLLVVLKNAEVADEVIEMLKKNNVICAYTADKDGRIEYINNAVFQFPKDEEVEI